MAAKPFAFRGVEFPCGTVNIKGSNPKEVAAVVASFEEQLSSSPLVDDPDYWEEKAADGRWRKWSSTKRNGGADADVSVTFLRGKAAPKSEPETKGAARSKPPKKVKLRKLTREEVEYLSDHSSDCAIHAARDRGEDFSSVACDCGTVENALPRPGKKQPKKEEKPQPKLRTDQKKGAAAKPEPEAAPFVLPPALAVPVMQGPPARPAIRCGQRVHYVTTAGTRTGPALDGYGKVIEITENGAQVCVELEEKITQYSRRWFRSLDVTPVPQQSGIERTQQLTQQFDKALAGKGKAHPSVGPRGRK